MSTVVNSKQLGINLQQSHETYSLHVPVTGWLLGGQLKHQGSIL